MGPGFYSDGSKNTKRVYKSNVLKPNTEYSCKIRTANQFGYSFYTDSKTITTGDVNT